ncbi:MAG: hypothetical protein CMK92_06180 [Pseudomonas sp.]|nr:hypothetical protein [Pseudomonas sp.]
MKRLINLIRNNLFGFKTNRLILNVFGYFSDDPGILPAPVSILIAAPGGGNIGDQAMLESFIKNTPGEKIVITSRSDGASLVEPYIDNVDCIFIDGLIYGNPIKFLPALQKFWSILRRSNRLYVVGADVMDGGYNVHASVMRSAIAEFAAKKGVPTRVLGFSWSNSPDVNALKSIASAASRGVTLFARDPVSYERLVTSKVEGVVLSSDTVFSNQNLNEDGIDDLITFCQGKKIAIVNASGLVSKSIDQLSEYKTIISHLKSLGFTVVLLPHVIREGANDLDICSTIYRSVNDVYLVDRLLTPDQVRRIVSEAVLVVTGRMHLSIISLSRGVPAIVLSTQGKVDGLMEYFDTRELSIEPTVGFSSEVIEKINQISSKYDYYTSLIDERLPSIVKLSNKNFNS